MLFNKTWTLTFGWMLAVDGCGVRCRTVDYRTATATWIVSHVQCICSGHQAPVAERCRPASPLPALPHLGPTTVSLGPAMDHPGHHVSCHGFLLVLVTSSTACHYCQPAYQPTTSLTYFLKTALQTLQSIFCIHSKLLILFLAFIVWCGNPLYKI